MIITDYIRVIPDFPKPGIQFFDMDSLFSSPVWPEVVMEAHQKLIDVENPTHVLGMESRGFVFGSALAVTMGLPFVMLRKPGKLPGEKISVTYDLEYGSDQLAMHTGILGHTSRVIIADDVLATGGTMDAAHRLVDQTGAKVVAHTVLVALSGLNKFEFSSPDYYLQNV